MTWEEGHNSQAGCAGKVSLRKGHNCKDLSGVFVGGHEGEPPGVLSLPPVHSFFRGQPQVSQQVPICALRWDPVQVSVTQGQIPAEGLAAHGLQVGGAIAGKSRRDRV